MAVVISQFERLMGENIDAFHMMVEGALKNWDGIYDVILIDREDYLIRAINQKNFSPYCHRLRGVEGGERQCLSCDLDAAREAGKNSDEGWVHLCDGGLLDIAAPIIVDGNVIAAILCGQARPLEEDLEETGLEQTIFLEKKYSMASGELVSLRNLTHRVSIQQMKDTAKRLAQMTRFVSRVLETQSELQKKNELLQKTFDNQVQFIHRLHLIEEALAPLFKLKADLDELWQTLDIILCQIAEILDAGNAAFLYYVDSKTSLHKTTLQSIAHMPNILRRGTSLDQDVLFQNWERFDNFYTEPFRGDIPGTLCAELKESWSNLIPMPRTLAIVRVSLTDEARGLLVFFLQAPEVAQGELALEQTELTLIASRITQAYNNTLTYKKKVEEERQRREWIKRIEHQVISPLNGVLGHAGRLKERFDDLRTQDELSDWENEDISGWQNNIYSLIDTTDWAVTLTRNLAWMADPEKSRQAVEQSRMETIKEVPLYIIECARYFQGIGHDYFLRIHVDVHSASNLDNRLHIYPDYFRMALQNLLDNAVKYSKRGTEVLVTCEATSGHGRINVTNTGLRLLPEECTKIFDYGYRTPTARARRRPGTGIGLSIAREIIRVHDGQIIAYPSEQTEEGWQTKMTIILPILQLRSN